ESHRPAAARFPSVHSGSIDPASSATGYYLRWAVSLTERTAMPPSGHTSIVDTPAASRNKRCKKASDAARAPRRISLIGEAGETITTTPPAYALTAVAIAFRVRFATVSNDSPPGGATAVEASQAAISSGQPACTSAKVSASHAPKSHSIRSSTTVTGTPPTS